MCLDDTILKSLKQGALFHDIGKTAISKDILNKFSNLTLDEVKMIKNHPKFGLKLLADNPKNEIIENVILLHHEKWNGTGYPFGLVGKEIPIEARIVSVANYYDILVNSSLQNRVSHKKALEILKNESGKAFDPDIISMFEIFEYKFKK